MEYRLNATSKESAKKVAEIIKPIIQDAITKDAVTVKTDGAQIILGGLETVPVIEFRECFRRIWELADSENVGGVTMITNGGWHV